MANERYPIIAHGELYVEPINKRSMPATKKYPHEYDEAKNMLLDDLCEIEKIISNESVGSSEIFLEQKIVCFRMEPKFEAKSYTPQSIISVSNHLELIGGRKYQIDEDTSAKLYFVKATNSGLQELHTILKSGQKDNIKSWRNQICSLRKIDFLDSEDKILGFEDDWNEGTVEIVLHPLKDSTNEAIDLFYSSTGISRENSKIKVYDDGITFISAKCTKDQLLDLSNLNVLRTVHPLREIKLSPARTAVSNFKAPVVEDTKKISTIKIGVFDGGANEAHPLLNNYITNIHATASKEDADCVDHGTAVCSTILHGCLSGKAGTTLPTPCVSVNSYRVLPLLDQNDIELYEVIDAIENIVPAEKDIKLYNVSLGPAGAILDDSISRFTYALDRLTYHVSDGELNPLFCIAAGNDGDLKYPFNRIQAPSDMVNGLAIGAYTYSEDGTKTRAYYSCVGEGREGAKVKPDILEFGGTAEHPFIVASNNESFVVGEAGTSFSSPLAVHKIGKLMAKSENITPHLGRALLIHSAEYKDNLSIYEQGFGFCPNNVDDILTCTDNDVTILYSGTLLKAQTVKLPIFSPQISKVSGMVDINWTIATIVDPCANDPDAYTSNCIEDTFVPNDMVFNFSKRGFPSKKLNLTNMEDCEVAKELSEKGFMRSDWPVSHPAKRYWDEKDLRNNDLKWDTVISKKLRMRGSSLLNPFLTLHAICRNDFDDNKVKYFVAISIKAPKYDGSLYNSILQNFRNLTPIEIRNINRIMVSSAKK